MNRAVLIGLGVAGWIAIIVFAIGSMSTMA